MINLGMVPPGSTLRIPFSSFAASGGSITMTNFAVGDIKIYKNGGTTERSSTNGFTLLDTDGTDFDGITGIHGFSIDLADDSDSGFYTAGADYWVVVSTVTVDGQTISFVAAVFSIGYVGAILNTTIASVSSQTIFTLTDGPAENSALRNMLIVIHDRASAVQKTVVYCSTYIGSSKTVSSVSATPTFTIAAGDNVSVIPVYYNLGVIDFIYSSSDISARRLAALAQEKTVSDTGNSTTAVNVSLDAFTADELQDRQFIVFNESNGYATGWISSYDTGNDLVISAEPLAFAPQDGDLFYLTNVFRGDFRTVIEGVADTGASTVSIPIKSSSVTPTVTDQWKGRVILFKKDTATANLRGQGAPIDGNTTTHITIAAGDALTTAPAEDDTWTIT